MGKNIKENVGQMKDKQREEYVEKKAKELIDKIEDIYPAFRSTTYWENFILSIIRDCQPKVSKEFIQKTMTYITAFPSQRRLIRVLIDAGVEVED